MRYNRVESEVTEICYNFNFIFADSKESEFVGTQKGKGLGLKTKKQKTTLSCMVIHNMT